MNPLATLPLVLFVVLFELAVGGAILAFVLERVVDTPLGFLRLTAVVDAAAAAFAVLIVPSLPQSAELVGRIAYVVVALMLVAFLATWTPWRGLRSFVNGVAALAGLALLVLASTARDGSAYAYDVSALVALPLGALSLGGVDAAMLLGHWYLVTPKLSPRPLQAAALLFFLALVLQAGMLALGASRGFVQIAWEANAVATILRIFVGIAAPLPIALAAWWTARLNTQSSTGLLYVALGMVLAGEIMARMIFYVSGVPI